ncbi:MAG: C40 family peptidase [Lachnospiraceae bacterium]|nr:C40 family peptidase [Candidatus Merdinaster equi]
MLQLNMISVLADVPTAIRVSQMGMSAASNQEIALPGENEADPDDFLHNGAGIETVIGGYDSMTADEFLSEMEDLTITRIKNEAENWGYTNLGIANVSETLNVRNSASENGSKVGELSNGAAVEILSEEDGWYKIESGKVSGYVKANYILTGDEAKTKAQENQKLSARVVANALKVRKQPDTKHGTYGLIYNGTELEVVEVLGDGWVSVKYADEEEAYVSGDYVDVCYSLDTALTISEALYGKGVTSAGIDLAQRAVQYVGHPYVYGGTSLTNGTDCSGFTMLLMKKYGVKLPHSARSQSRMGVEVSMSALQPGDLVFYSDSTGVNHVTVYIGNGQVCHASNPRSGIKISEINYRKPTCARRFL